MAAKFSSTMLTHRSDSDGEEQSVYMMTKFSAEQHNLPFSDSVNREPNLAV